VQSNKKYFLTKIPTKFLLSTRTNLFLCT